MFGAVSIVQTKYESQSGELTVIVNVKVNSTGWSVEHTTETNDQGEITKVVFTPKKPTGRVGMGFPSNGQDFEIQIPGPFADEIDVSAGQTSTKVEIPS